MTDTISNGPINPTSGDTTKSGAQNLGIGETTQAGATFTGNTEQNPPVVAGGPTPVAPLLLTPKLDITLAPGVYNDYNPSGPAVPGGQTIDASRTSVLSIETSGATITGIVGGSLGRLLIIYNYGGGPITLTNEDVGSAAANRLIFPNAQSLTLQPNEACILLYDDNTDGNIFRWRSIAAIQATPDFPLSPYLGDGSDGAHVVAGTEDLAGANRFYTDLTIPPGARLVTKGGLILCRGTFTNGGTLAYHVQNGMNGGNGAVSTGGGGGGGSFPNTYCGSGANGAAGVTNGTNGNAGNGAGGPLSTWPGLTAGSVAGGAVGANGNNGTGPGMGGSGGGAGAGQTGGASGAVGTNTPASEGSPHMPDRLLVGRPNGGSSTANTNPWACGSSGGTGGAQAGTGASGGGGGAAGTLIVLCNKYVDNGGIMDAHGGNAGTSFLGTSAGVGGSAGGGGGVIVFACFARGQVPPPAASFVITGGLGALGVGTGKNGGNGADGLVFKLNPNV